MTNLAQVLPIRDTTAHDVPAMLRQLADTIDALPYTVQCTVLTAGPHGVAIYGFGGVNGADAHLMCGCAMQKLQEAVNHG